MLNNEFEILIINFHFLYRDVIGQNSLVDIFSVRIHEQNNVAIERCISCGGSLGWQRAMSFSWGCLMSCHAVPGDRCTTYWWGALCRNWGP